MDILNRKYWIFDLDGTLTVAVHDFAAIRRELDLPPERPILEQLARMPDEHAAPRHVRLDEIEAGLVERARAHPGIEPLLTTLEERGAVMGILTRNNKRNALATLRVCGLAGHFDPRFVMGRESCALKPSGDGIRRLLDLWGASAGDAVMVGDYLFDLLAGRDAGTATVYVDPTATFEHEAWADVSVTRFDEIVAQMG